MDEMEEYRDRIDKRQNERRNLKNNRRHNDRHTKQPKMFDAVFVIDLLIFAGLFIVLFFFQ